MLKQAAALIGLTAIALAAVGPADAARLITGKQIKDNSITGRDIRNRTISSLDLSDDAIDHIKTQIEPGPAGPQGPQGPQGPPGTQQVIYVDGPAGTQCGAGGGACQVASSEAACPAGSVAVGGGYEIKGSLDEQITFAKPLKSAAGTSFGVVGVNYDNIGATVQARVACASGAVSAMMRASSFDLLSAVNSARARLSARSR